MECIILVVYKVVRRGVADMNERVKGGKKMDDGCLFKVGGVRRLGMLIVFHFEEICDFFG
jgi:hypothetical protein